MVVLAIVAVMAEDVVVIRIWLRLRSASVKRSLSGVERGITNSARPEQSLIADYADVVC